MAKYPSEIYSPRAKANKAGVVYEPEKKTIGFVEDVTKLDDEVVSIETELGTEPKGDFEDVKTALVELGKKGLIFIIDGGGAAIKTGEKGHLQIPFKCEIVKVTLLAGQTGSIRIDIWKNTYENFPPDVNDTICGITRPEIEDGIKYEDAALEFWEKTINAGDILAFNVSSVTDIERVMILLEVKNIA